MPDPDAAREFYERHVEAVFRFAVRRCRDPEDVSDLRDDEYEHVERMLDAARLAPAAERALAVT